MKSVRVFVSSPGDTHFERMRVERVVERLNGEFSGVAKLEAIRWENQYYQARATFQQQIPEACECDLVVAILRHRIGTELPDDFPTMPNGERYPSGTAYEILSAIEASKTKSVPDVYVFRYSEPPTVKLDDEATNQLVSEQWNRLKSFFKTWFQTQDGKFKLAFHSFQSTDQFETEIEKLLRTWLEEKVLKGRSVLWPIDTKGSPFRGLAAFGAKHAPVFFGRSRDITKAVDALKDAGTRATPFLLIVGASGSGKSSLALAGLVPRLTAPGVVPAVDLWRVAVMRPGEHEGGPVAALAARLFDTASDNEDECPLAALPEMASSDYATPAELAKLLAHADDSCAKPILKALDRIAAEASQKSGYDRPVRADLLLVIDQLDELFASEVSEAERTPLRQAHRPSRGDGSRLGDRHAARRSLRALPERAGPSGDEDQRRDLRSRASRRHRDRRDHSRAGNRRRARLRDRPEERREPRRPPDPRCRPAGHAAAPAIRPRFSVRAESNR